VSCKKQTTDDDPLAPTGLDSEDLHGLLGQFDSFAGWQGPNTTGVS
jgi:hypothetical protein